MATYEIKPERRTLHGHFSAELAPILTVDSGDTVRLSTIDAAWAKGPPAALGMWQQIFPLDKERDLGHALCGPIAVRGAKPGMTLEVRINELRVGSWGWTVSASVDDAFTQSLGVAGQQALSTWQLDAENCCGYNQFGQRVRLSPFMGVLGMPPAAPGIHSTSAPRIWGGNIDCKELVVGSSLFLPIPVEGALFSVGDGHALQGDGEVGGSAIECPMELVDLTLVLHPDLHLQTARACTPHGWITFGFDEDLNKAIQIALNAMLDLLESEYQLHRSDALALASVVVDLRITQIVNGVRGVHAILPHQAVSRPIYPTAYHINVGGEAVDFFRPDGYCYGGGLYGGGQTGAYAEPVTTEQVVQAAPDAVYKTYRAGEISYVLPGLQAREPYRVRLHFIEPFWEQAKKRCFDVMINSRLVLRNFDIYAVAGGKGAVTIQEWTLRADSRGRITIVFLPGLSGVPICSAIEVYPAQE